MGVAHSGERNHYFARPVLARGAARPRIVMWQMSASLSFALTLSKWPTFVEMPDLGEMPDLCHVNLAGALHECLEMSISKYFSG